MTFSLWNGHDSVDVETPKTPQRKRTHSSGSCRTPVPGSPSIVFLKAPVVLQRQPGEHTKLLPSETQQRPESHASKQIKRCQLVAVVLISLVTAAVIISFLAGDPRTDNGRR
ncbi:unnamed protein product [Ectocarpus sp. 12 AP-2014]